ARTAAELGLGPLRFLDEVIPELALHTPAPGRPPNGEGGGGADGPISPPAAHATGGASPCAQGCAHADLNVVDGGVPSPESAEKHDVSLPEGASLNPLIVVRIHAPEQGFARRGPRLLPFPLPFPPAPLRGWTAPPRQAPGWHR